MRELNVAASHALVGASRKDDLTRPSYLVLTRLIRSCALELPAISIVISEAGTTTDEEAADEEDAAVADEAG
ncbi:hypothetical protein [Legionella moravica]|uniref:hypothetical protein n=1 Tax=Legionella moravica TaxID=39962 RepID=UPI0011C08046|nr:hypothetical protein [Legionella moravica]